VVLGYRDKSGRDFPHLAVRWATRVPGGLLILTLGADVDDIAPLGTLLGAPVVRSAEFIERRRLGLNVLTRYCITHRIAGKRHKRHPRQ
jgi:hypothetical protein